MAPTPHKNKSIHRSKTPCTCSECAEIRAILARLADLDVNSCMEVRVGE